MAAMLNTKPLQLQDGWPVSSYDQAYLDDQAMSGVTRWIEENYEYHNIHAVLVEHAGHLVYEVYLRGKDQRWGYPLGDRVFNVDSLHDLRAQSQTKPLCDQHEKALRLPANLRSRFLVRVDWLTTRIP